ncbi:MAG: FmdB family zinc ribbon protein [Acidimicrobiales bacterium]
MPTYEYACKQCGEHLEVVQSFTDDPLSVCPRCSGELRKVFGSVGIVFKGSGFYKNDSRTGAKPSKEYEPAAAKSASSNGDSAGVSPSKEKAEKSDKADKASTPEAKPAAAKSESKPAAAAS